MEESFKCKLINVIEESFYVYVELMRYGGIFFSVRRLML